MMSGVGIMTNDDVDLVISTLTIVGCLLVIISMGSWLLALRRNITPLWFLFMSIVFAKSAILFLAISWLAGERWFTVSARSLLLISVFIQLVVVVTLWYRRPKGKWWWI